VHGNICYPTKAAALDALFCSVGMGSGTHGLPMYRAAATSIIADDPARRQREAVLTTPDYTRAAWRKRVIGVVMK
jgi:hypothetical protein